MHGSVSQLLDDAGNVKASYGYSAYGGADAPSSDAESLTSGDPDPQAPLNPYRYSSRRMDSGTVPSGSPAVASGAGGYDMGARRFGPDLGSFLQQDQFSGALADLGLALDPLTQNRYALAGGNPISYVEWDGHVAQTLQQLENINAEPAVTDPDPKTQRLINANSLPPAGPPANGAAKPGAIPQDFTHRVANAPCGARDFAQMVQTNQIPLEAGSHCGIYMLAPTVPGGPVMVVPGTLNLSDEGGSGGRSGTGPGASGQSKEEIAQSLYDWVDRVHKALKTVKAQENRTTAAIFVRVGKQFYYLFAGSGEEGLTGAQVDAIRSEGGTPLFDRSKLHAEKKILNAVEGLKKLYGTEDVELVAGATSRVICPDC